MLLYFTFRNLCLEPEESLLVSGTEGGQILKVESSALEVDQDVLDEESRYILFGLLQPNHLNNWRETVIILCRVCFYELSVITS